MPAHVAEYRLSVRARLDLLDIYAYSEAKFGRYQAEAYHAGLERTYGLLADVCHASGECGLVAMPRSEHGVQAGRARRA
jgi:plasmid stabilization system protein ParE